MNASTVLRVALLVARGLTGAIAVRRLAAAARTAPPIEIDRAENGATPPSISVVVPARDEAARIGPLLDSIVGAPGVGEVLVVDDESSDATASVARSSGATVLTGEPLPPGWAGKTWALEQGIRSVDTAWVVTLDADTRPHPGLPGAIVARAEADRFDLLTAGGRFDCPTRPARWLHAAMLTTLVYRFGPPGTVTAPDRAMANGQCMAIRRAAFLDGDGLAAVRREVVEDIALARAWAGRGRAVGFVDAADLLTVRMFESLPDTWTGWSRSLALPGVETLARQLLDLTVVSLTQAAPLLRLLARRADPLDLALLALRTGTLVGTRTAYDRNDLAYWLSPLADAAAAVGIAKGIAARGRQTWRGRTYG